MRQILAVALTLSLPLMGADARWERLREIRSGERIWIEYQEGKELKSRQGEMRAWTEEGLRILLKRSETKLARSDVRKVSVYGGKTRGRGAAVGALVGAAAGAGLMGAAVAGNSSDLDAPPAGVIGLGAALFAGVGAVVGLAVGMTKKVTVYEAAPKR